VTRVAIVIEAFNPSGGVRVLTALANALATGGFETTVVHPMSSHSPHFPLDSRVKQRPTAGASRAGKAGFLFDVLAWRLANRCIAVTSSYRILVALGLARLLAGGPRPVMLVQGDDGRSLIALAPTSGGLKLVNRALLWLSRRVPSECLFVSDHLRRIDGRPGEVIHNFVSDAILNSPRSSVAQPASLDVHIGFAGTAAQNKGFALYAAASRRLGKDPRLVRARLSFGCATRDPELLAHPAGHGGVEMVSPAQDVELAAFYAECDIFLSLSESEGFGLPGLESMACGCALITTDSGGVGDYVEAGKNAVLLPARSIDAIVEAVVQLVLDSDLRTRLAQAGLQTASRFPMSRFRDRHCQYFKNLENSR
jgi:glycosyltransferase involved in cell wall biosynthesis